MTQDCDEADVARGAAAPLNTSIFHKTKVCMYYHQGGCKQGATCRFAHGSTDLRPLPDLCRTKLCPTIKAGGSCGEPECCFAHDTRDLCALPSSQTNTTSKDGVKPHRDIFYRTQLCKFHLKGFCLRGANCKYAHGSSLKHPLPDSRCTRLCQTLTRNGECKDTSCSFAHVIREVMVVDKIRPEMCEAVRYKLVEKQTFLEWEPVLPSIRRCASAPGSIGTQ